MKFSYIQQFFFFSLLIGTTAVFFWMLGSYLLPVLWAIVIAVVFCPMYLTIERSIGGRSSIASILTIAAVVATVLLPLVVIGGMIVQESYALYESVAENQQSGQSFSLLEKIEEVLAYAEPYGVSKEAATGRLRELIGSASQTLASSLFTIGQMTFSFLVSTVILLYLLFSSFVTHVSLLMRSYTTYQWVIRTRNDSSCDLLRHLERSLRER